MNNDGNLTIYEAIDEAMSHLMDPDINEKLFYDEIPTSQGKQKVLNVHGVRLIASFTKLRIKSTQSKETDEFVTVKAIAGFEGDEFGYESEVDQPLRYRPKKEGELGALDKDARAKAYTRAERNAMLGLMPARYIVMRIESVTKSKEDAAEQAKLISEARNKARDRAIYLTNIGGDSSVIFTSVKEELGDDEEKWTKENWQHLENMIDKSVYELESDDEDEEEDEVDTESIYESDDENVNDSEPEVKPEPDID